MDKDKNIPESKKNLSLEAELKRLETELSQKSREIEVEKALEKIREKALDMRKSAELSQTSIILFQQLKELKIEAIRSGVGIFDDEGDAIELWVTSVTEEGKLFFILDYINISVHPIFESLIKARKELKPFALSKLEGKELLQYYRTMSNFAGISRKIESTLAEYYYSFFFSAGTINVVSSKAMTEEETDIMLRVAKVFGLLYTRFLDLKKSEEQAALINEEKKALQATLDDLKATQAQLIQSEKMASLGELTAGIAHEIQNPLNFVNNFSEVNAELIEELNAERLKPNAERDEALENDILKDIKENSEKINHHGKRAGDIVKGMLQHSRTSTGQKELIDINALCDEYLRLAYHGLRAKDKSFNAKFETSFDETLPKINVVPQDIGRVVLNLINNAFYAASLNPSKGGTLESYNSKTPTVWVSTKKEPDKVLISVKDNGPGIPKEILDKIFQPFFTTKPTGQGTGLGLSLSYDIVKAHGGEIKVETKESEGSEFIILIPRN